MVTFYLLSVVVLGPQHSNHFHGQHDSSRCSPASRVVALFFTSLVPKEGTVKLYLLSAVVIGKAPAFESFNHFIASTNPFVALLFIFLVPKEGTVKCYLLSVVVIGIAPAFESLS